MQHSTTIISSKRHIGALSAGKVILEPVGNLELERAVNTSLASADGTSEACEGYIDSLDSLQQILVEVARQ